MVVDITNGITMTLGNLFEDCEIYTKNVEQGIETPCFFVQLLKPDSTPMIGTRCIMEYPYDVHFFPKDDGDNESMLDMGDALIECLEYITLLNGRKDDPMKNYGLKVEVRNDK